MCICVYVCVSVCVFCIAHSYFAFIWFSRSLSLSLRVFFYLLFLRSSLCIYTCHESIRSRSYICVVIVDDGGGGDGVDNFLG